MIPGDGEELLCPAVGDVAAVAGGGRDKVTALPHQVLTILPLTGWRLPVELV